VAHRSDRVVAIEVALPAGEHRKLEKVQGLAGLLSG
jgi:hypothetical protein